MADEPRPVMSDSELQALVNEAREHADRPAVRPAAEGAEPTPASEEQARPLRLEELPSAGRPSAPDAGRLDLLKEVSLDVRIELGRTEMFVEDVLALSEGSIVTLDRLAGDPVDILVNGRLVAKGEVLVLNDNFCVRIAEILPAGD